MGGVELTLKHDGSEPDYGTHGVHTRGGAMTGELLEWHDDHRR
jgi:hypothetical protein